MWVSPLASKAPRQLAQEYDDDDGYSDEDGKH
jgi:hypothetical protein